MKIYNKLTWAVLLLVIGMYSCTQQSEQVVPGANLTPMTNKAEIKTKFDQRRANFAKALAKAMRNSEVRDFIKTEASKKFDGDFDIHFGMTKGAKVGQATFLQTIQNNLAVESGRINKEAFMTDVLNEDPLLNIAVPVHINDWNVANYQPLVAVLTEAYDDQKSSHIVAYDAEGKEHWIDAKNEPNVPVVVIGWNERLKSTTEYQQRVRDISIIQPCEEEIMLRTAPAYTTPDGKQAFYHYNFADIALRCSGGGGGGGGGTGGGSGSGSGSGSSSCLRPGKAYERLVDMYFTKSGLNKYEGWPAGAPEVDLRVYTPDKDRNYDEAKRMRFIDDMEPRKRKDIKDKWWNPGNLSLLYWDEDVHGTVLYVHFVEDDKQLGVQLKEIKIKPSFEVKLPLVGKAKIALEIKFEINSKDEDMGGMTIDKCAGYPDRRGGKSCYNLNQYFSFRLGR